jgi:hypothetical protein
MGANGKPKDVHVPQRIGKPKELFPEDPKRAKWVLDRIDSLAQTINEAYVEICELVYEVNKGGYYKQLKHTQSGDRYDRFEEYVEDRLGWKDRKGRYFVAIQKKLVLEGGLKKKDLAKIEWSKAGRLSSLPSEERSPERLKEWVTKAKDMTVDELQAEINKAKNKALPTGSKRHSEEVFEKEVFHLAPAQAKNVRKALALAEKTAGSDKRGHLIDLICTAFVADGLEEKSVKVTHICDAIERTFGVAVVAIDEAEKVVYGSKTAKKYGVS